MHFRHVDYVTAENEQQAVDVAFAAFEGCLKYTEQVLNEVGLSFALKTDEKEFTMGCTKVAVREDGTYHVELSAEIGKDLTKEQSDAFNAFLITLNEEK